MSEWGIHEPLLGGIWTTQGGYMGHLGLYMGHLGFYMGHSGDTWVPRVIHGSLG